MVTRASSRSRAQQAADALTSVVVIALVVGAVLYGRARHRLAPRPSAAQCTSLLQRHVELTSLERYPTLRPEVIAAQQVSSLRRQEATSDIEDCQRALNSSQVACGLRAPSLAELERCLQ